MKNAKLPQHQYVTTWKTQAKYFLETLTRLEHLYPVGYFPSYTQQKSANLINLLKLEDLTSF